MLAAARVATALLSLPARLTNEPMMQLSSRDFAGELSRRGLQTALDQLEADGPSAFKDPCKVIEYVMLCLQHRPVSEASREAMRFTCREPGKSSFVSGLALSEKRVSWRTSRLVGNYISGRALAAAEFESELVAHFGLLFGCATWSFAVRHPTTFAPLARVAADDFLREYVLLVDDQPMAVRLLYDWGCWCYLVASVELLDGVDDCGAGGWAVDELSSDEGGRKRSRGGSL